MNKIIAFGNPLLDTLVRIPNDDILRKHNLKQDDQKEITRPEMELLLQDIKE